jgi:hypothetical protein
MGQSVHQQGAPRISRGAQRLRTHALLRAGVTWEMAAPPAMSGCGVLPPACPPLWMWAPPRRGA